ncbi:hypothetical protein RUM44_005008 [Polyplax serrata]|uniref:Uncharacterized protein n=1 Tax=Polyplax serrata TaxID=468196 RepID=A0ABR1AWN1_POLSC
MEKSNGRLEAATSRGSNRQEAEIKKGILQSFPEGNFFNFLREMNFFGTQTFWVVCHPTIRSANWTGATSGFSSGSSRWYRETHYKQVKVVRITSEPPQPPPPPDDMLFPPLERE